ncbi:ThiamineS/Molybdopterin converting factor subunit 1 [Corchorus olitorius]|uniref:ThiamineS/Molybdopterin converting factor subunit 1 n=1 Tax=Corchorus olitorius TaxID=93759 RepID=A0A1R3L0Z3_9ROSI|nr:ThiamineS/Molybdopterin converting factor subunit 1 [Corchorus olitorius]
MLSCHVKRMITVFVNNQTVLTPDATSLRSLLTQLALADKKGIAVAVNNAIVPRLAWEHFIVAMREITLSDTVTHFNGKETRQPNAAVTVYDTSGPYTDPNATIDLKKGLPASANHGSTIGLM